MSDPSTAMDVDTETSKEDSTEKEEKKEEEVDPEMAAMEAEWASMTDDEIEQRTRLIQHEISVLLFFSRRGSD